MLYISEFVIDKTQLLSNTLGEEKFKESFFKRAAQELGIKVCSNHKHKLDTTVKDDHFEHYKNEVVVVSRADWENFRSGMNMLFSHYLLRDKAFIESANKLFNQIDHK